MATTTNYSWTTPDNTAYVKDGASAIRTLGSSVDTTLFSVTGGKNVGHQLINTTSFTAASSVSLDNVFTSAYANYQVLLNVSGTVAANITMNMRAAGATNSTSNYFYGAVAIVFGVATPAGSQAQSATTWTEAGRTNAGGPGGGQFMFINPQLAAKTFVQNTTTDEAVTRNVGMMFNATTQFDGFLLAPTSGTITGTVRVYGLRNS
jgi:hypothetical protein